MARRDRLVKGDNDRKLNMRGHSCGISRAHGGKEAEAGHSEFGVVEAERRLVRRLERIKNEIAIQVPPKCESSSRPRHLMGTL